MIFILLILTTQGRFVIISILKIMKLNHRELKTERLHYSRSQRKSIGSRACFNHFLISQLCHVAFRSKYHVLPDPSESFCCNYTRDDSGCVSAPPTVSRVTTLTNTHHHLTCAWPCAQCVTLVSSPGASRVFLSPKRGH